MAEKIYEPKTKEEKKKFGRGGEKIYEPKTKKEKKDLAKKNLRKSATKPKFDLTPEDKPTSPKSNIRTKSLSGKEFMKMAERAEKKRLKKRNERGEGPRAFDDMIRNYKRTGEPKGLKKGGRVGLKSDGLAIRGKGCEIK